MLNFKNKSPFHVFPFIWHSELYYEFKSIDDCELMNFKNNRLYQGMFCFYLSLCLYFTYVYGLCLILVLQNQYPCGILREDVYLWVLFDKHLIYLLGEKSCTNNVIWFLKYCPLQMWISKIDDTNVGIDPKFLNVSFCF